MMGILSKRLNPLNYLSTKLSQLGLYKSMIYIQASQPSVMGMPRSNRTKSNSSLLCIDFRASRQASYPFCTVVTLKSYISSSSFTTLNYIASSFAHKHLNRGCSSNSISGITITSNCLAAGLSRMSPPDNIPLISTETGELDRLLNCRRTLITLAFIYKANDLIAEVFEFIFARFFQIFQISSNIIVN